MANIFTSESFGSDLPENYSDICTILNTYAENHPDEDSNEIWEAYWNGTLNQKYFLDMAGERFTLETVDTHDVVFYGRFSELGIEENDPEYTNKLDDYFQNMLHIAPEMWEVG